MRYRSLLLFIIFCLLFTAPLFSQEQQQPPGAPRWQVGTPGKKPIWYPYTYLRRNDSQEGDEKVVIVPATNKRQAMLDAQTYHVGWNAVDAWAGQSRVMYCVLLRKRPPYISGQPPVMRRIPKERQ
ncbi:MAG: hypothetical protein LBN39_13650 [Planctomycetaceae bacterium]|jgi:hypothetical protein|nr:hypothetical protein [Planctomycetaceae bacterium]